MQEPKTLLGSFTYRCKVFLGSLQQVEGSNYIRLNEFTWSIDRFVLALLLLGERATYARLGLLLFGFAGVLLVVKPGFGFTPGLGWALMGSCPGPIYVLLGNGYWIFLVVIASATLGTFAYGVVKDKLPH